MTGEYRFAQDSQGKEMLERFSNMLDTAEKLKDECLSKGEALLEVLFTDLFWLERLGQDFTALQDSYYASQIENVRFTLESIKQSVGQGTAHEFVRWQLPCFLKELREELYFGAYVQPFPERWAPYYQEEFAAHHQNPAAAAKACKCEVSIFVPAKDKLEYTRRCVESILRETDPSVITYELILINHGSRDETQAYFASVPGAKRLHFKENVRMMMFSSAMRVCEGRYMAFVSNDTVVTKDWLPLLHRCIQSDAAIVSATPVTPNVSNFQAVAGVYDNLEEMARFAAGYNRHDPSEWEQRARVLPVIALYDLEKLNAIGFGDRYFRTMEFWDDDFSLRARRAGYRQILCRSVFCHHEGSLTGGEAQRQENTLEKGRELFIAKHGADPWENGAYYDYSLCTRLRGLALPQGPKASVLGIDAGFGDTLLQIGNLLRKGGVETFIDGITTERPYVADLRGISRAFALAEDEEALLESLRLHFADGKYDFAYLARPLEQYRDWKKLLTILCDKLKPEGWLLFYLSNALNSANFQWFACLSFPIGQERLNYLNPDRVGLQLEPQLETVVVERKRSGISASFLTQLASRVYLPRLPAKEVELLLDTLGFYYFARKRGEPED